MNYFTIPGLIKTVSALPFTIQKPEEIIEEAICQFYKLEKGAMHKKTRKTEIKEPRQVFQYLLFLYSNYSLEHIGMFSGKDHSTVIYSVKTIKNFRSVNRIFDSEMKAIIKTIESYGQSLNKSRKEHSVVTHILALKR